MRDLTDEEWGLLKIAATNEWLMVREDRDADGKWQGGAGQAADLRGLGLIEFHDVIGNNLWERNPLTPLRFKITAAGLAHFRAHPERH